MVINEIVRATISYLIQNGSVAQNVLHWILTNEDVADGTVLDAIAGWITTDFGAEWADMGSDECTMTEVEADIVQIGGTVDRNIGTETLDIDGELPSSVLPAANALYLQANCLPAGVFGRKYIPGLQEAGVAAGLWVGSTLTDGAAMLADYMDTIVVPVIGGILVPGVPSSKTSAFEPFTGVGFLDTVPAYQRRRKPGVGS